MFGSWKPGRGVCIGVLAIRGDFLYFRHEQLCDTFVEDPETLSVPVGCDPTTGVICGSMRWTLVFRWEQIHTDRRHRDCDARQCASMRCRAYDSNAKSQNSLNRWYDATVGRWASEDPRRFTADDTNTSRYCFIASCIVNEPFRDQKANTRGWSTAVCAVERGSLATSVSIVAQQI
jgi:hypothetical protein